VVGKNFGELVISKFWRGKLWQMLDTCIWQEENIGKSEDESSFVNLLKWFAFNETQTLDQ